MNGLIIEYDYDGDRGSWETAVDVFVGCVSGDPTLKGKFHYIVNEIPETPHKVHIARWADEETLKALQSQNYFKDFASKIKDFAGDTLKTTKLAQFAETK